MDLLSIKPAFKFFDHFIPQRFSDAEIRVFQTANSFKKKLRTVYDIGSINGCCPAAESILNQLHSELTPMIVVYASAFIFEHTECH